MSQFFVNNSGTAPPPPSVATSYITNSGTAVPAANVLNVLATESAINVDAGITTIGSGNTVTALLTNRMTNIVTTTTAAPTTILTLPLGAVPGVYYIEGNVLAFDLTDVAGAGYGFEGAARTTGAAGIEISTQYEDIFEENALMTADITVVISGNSLLVQVEGVAGKTIDWNGYLTYRFVS